jgi:hypothetical protein
MLTNGSDFLLGPSSWGITLPSACFFVFMVRISAISGRSLIYQ